MKPEEAKIEQAVAALLASPRVEDAARACGVSRTTLWRMMQETEFQSRLAEARLSLSREICVSLQANALDAVGVLRTVMLDTESPASTRVAAAGKLLDLSLRAREQLELEERVAELERLLTGRGRVAGKEKRN